MRIASSYFGAALIFLLGVGIGMFGTNAFTTSSTPSSVLKDSLQQSTSTSGDLTLINPLLDCTDLPTAIGETGVNRLKSSITKYLDSMKQNETINNASVYYRDLNNGPWMLIGGGETYSPGSLLKVPVALSYYARSESTPGILDKKITYAQTGPGQDAVQPYAPQTNVESGHTYTVKELINIMLEQSSNDAAVALIQNAGDRQVEDTFAALGMTVPAPDQEYKVGVHDFSTFLRVLYNATYLSRKDSEEVRAILSQTSYKDGLVAGVPSGITVAHKFGTRGEDDGTADLHDCGIIYVPKNPYMLCVMTHGYEFSALSSVVAHISSLTYQYVSNQ